MLMRIWNRIQAMEVSFLQSVNKFQYDIVKNYKI